jgi:hypothetical protein
MSIFNKVLKAEYRKGIEVSLLGTDMLDVTYTINELKYKRTITYFRKRYKWYSPVTNRTRGSKHLDKVMNDVISDLIAQHEVYLIEREQKEEHEMLAGQLERILGYTVTPIEGKHDPNYLHFEVRLPKTSVIIKKVHNIMWQVGSLYSLNLSQITRIIDIVAE